MRKEVSFATGRAARLLPLFSLSVAIVAGGPAIAEEGAHHFPFSFVNAIDKQAAPAEQKSTGFRVLGGQVAASGAWPWQVALISSAKSDPFDGQYCGGSLVANQWVLTAAHCVYTENEDGTTRPIRPDEIRVLAGTNILKAESGEVIDVVSLHPHPGYDAVRIDNDIALIKLAKAPDTDSTATVRLPSPAAEEQLAAAGTSAIVTGWGRLEDGNFPVDLREVRIEIMARESCNQSVLQARSEKAQAAFREAARALDVGTDVADQAWQTLVAAASAPLTENMVCSGTPAGGKGSCNGDSGGPLLIAMNDGTYMQVGIVSWGFSAAEGRSCEVSASFSAYTRISNYQGWLTSIVSAN